MFLKRLFTFPKSNTILEGYISSSKIIISNNDNIINDKEIILLGLLIYSRILRFVPSKEEKKTLLDFFIEIHSNYHSYDSEKNFFNDKEQLLKRLTVYPHKQIKLKYKKEEKGNYYIDLGVITEEVLFTTISMTAFLYCINNVSEKNKLKVYEAFSLLSILYKQNNFNINDAIDIPNEIIFDTIPFE